MRAEVLSWCRREGLIAAGDRVLCAVSGGADSMAMLWCLHSLREELSISVCAVHFNHRLRGAESDRDEAFVRAFCAEHGIELTVGTAAVDAYTASGVEETARRLRYAFFETLPCDKLATAHTADDNAETVLLHLLRGAGLRGLCGIPPRRGRYIRPLLCVTRGQITDYLRQEGIMWVEDSSNAADDCRRNRLRHQVMPLLKLEMPELAERLTEQSALLRAEDSLLDSLAQELLDRAARETGWHCQTLLEAPDVLQKRALRVALRKESPCNVTSVHIEALQRLLAARSPSAQLSLPNGLTVCRVYDCITIERKLPTVFPETRLEPAGVTRIPELGLCVTCRIEENFKKTANTPFQFTIKYDMIKQPVIFLRPRRTGDTLSLDGKHTVRLKKLLIDRKIPRMRRERIAVLATEERVLAVEGLGVDFFSRPVAGQPALIIQLEKEEM